MLEKHLITGGIDTDSSDEYIKSSDYRYGLNIHCGVTDIGNITNIQGNLLLSFDLPNGTNKCIGGKYDNKTNTIIWFVYNDLENHQILQYEGNKNKINRVLLEPLLNFNKDFLITAIDIFEGMLFWTDNYNPPRKINIEKAKMYSEPPVNSWDFFDNAGNFTQFDKKKIGFISKTPHTFKAGDKVIIVQSQGAVFEEYDGFTTILAVNSGLVSGYPYDITIDKDGLGNTPPNGGYAALSVDGLMPYIAPFKEEYIELIKYEIPCPPIVSYGDDNEKKVNNLKDKLFQFKVRNIFDDNEKSAWSPISKVPYPVIFSKDADTNGKNNLIKIIVNTGSSIATRIEIAAREGNLGDFYLIADLNKDNLCIKDDSTYTYNWYNDGVYNNIEINESNKLFDSVPLLAKAQTIIKGNRLAFGNITEGYDPVEVNAKLGVTIAKDLTQETQKTYSIKGKIRIVNPYHEAYFNTYQPIYKSDDSGNGNASSIIFGGVSKYNYENGVLDNYKQEIPLGGFVMYLAGTKHYSISKQKFNNKVGQSPDTFPPPSIPGIYIVLNNTNKQDLNDLILKQEVYSEFEIKNVPNGTYILRVAGHETTQTTIDNGSYQNTSTYTQKVGGVVGAEIVVTVNGSDVTVGDTEIRDLIDARLGHHSTAVAGYLIENSGNTIEQAIINALPFSVIKTDHNGYFYNTSSLPIPLSVPFITVVQIMNTILTTSAFGSTDFGKLTKNNITATDNSQLSNLKTTLSGNITSGGLPLKGITVVSSGGGDGITDINGHYEVTVYGYNTSPNRRDGILYFMLGDGLTGTPPSPFSYTVLIGTGANEYNSTNFPPSFTNIANIFGLITTTYLARAGVYQYGLVYYDKANRSGLTNTYIESDKECNTEVSTIPTDGLKVTIPFYTENLKKQLTPEEQTKADYLNATVKSGTEASFAFFNASNISNQEYQLTFDVNDAQQAVNVAQANYDAMPTFANQLALNNANVALFNATQTAFTAGVSYTDINDKINRANASATQYISDATNAGLNVNDFVAYSNDYKTSTSVGFGSPVSASVTASFCFDLVTKGTGQAAAEYNSLSSTGISGGSYPIINWELLSKPPIWATHYQWVRTLDSAINSKIQILADSIVYVKENRTPSGQPYNDDLSVKIKIGFKNLIKYNDDNPNSQLNYGYAKGDRLRFKKKNNGDFFNDYYDFDIIAYDPAGYIYINNLLALGDLSQEAGCEIELYTPKLSTKDQIYYEIGECYEITNAGTENRKHSVTSGQFTTGDVYYRTRTMAYNSETATPLYKTFLVEDYNFNDFFSSKVADIGRPQLVDNTAKRINRPTTIFYSERYIPETNINGLSSFFDTSFELFSRQYGSIQYLYSRDTWLHIYQELKVANVPIEQTVFTNNSGSSVVGASANVLDARNAQYYLGEFGIGQHPESFAVYENSEYFVDVKRGAVLRLSNNGIINIAKNQTYKFFTELFKEINEVGKKVNIYGVYDIKRGEYILSIDTEGTNLKMLPKKDIILTLEEIAVLKDLQNQNLLDGILKQQGMTDDEINEFKEKYLK